MRAEELASDVRAMNEVRTVAQELADLGVDPNYFTEFYAQLKPRRKFPSKAEVPGMDYDVVVSYLRNKSVLGERRVCPRGLAIFDKMKSLEEQGLL